MIMINHLDEKTTISIGIALSLIGGSAVWMTSLNVQSSSNTKAIDRIEEQQLLYTRSIQNIERDIAIIKAKAEVIEQISKRK